MAILAKKLPVHPREPGLPSLQRSFSNDVLQPFFQCHVRLESERRLGGRYIGCRVPDVPFPRGLVDRLRLDPEQHC
jgi:hypothetical protein